MRIISKEKPLEESLSLMKESLASLPLSYSFIDEKHPLNHCYSLHLETEGISEFYSNGKGACTLSAVASAMGEYIERLQTGNFFYDFYLETPLFFDAKLCDFDGAYLNESLKAFYDIEALEKEDLIDFNSDEYEQIATLPFEEMKTGESVYFPISILQNLYGSNGMASGNTPKEAQVQALSEIYERHVKYDVLKNGYALPLIPSEVIKAYPKTYHDIEKLRELGYSVNVHDASLGGKYPVVAISFIDPKNGTLFLSFGAHSIFEAAFERTLTEILQGREVDGFSDLLSPTFDQEAVGESYNLVSHFIDSNGVTPMQFLSRQKSFDHTPWKFEREKIEDQHALLLSLTDQPVYLREYDTVGFYSCQIVIPSFSEVYPIDDLLYNNSNRGKFYRDVILSFTEIPADEVLEEIEEVEDSLDVGKFIGVRFRDSFTFGELKASLYLSLESVDEALYYLQFSQKKKMRVVRELLLMKKEGLLFEDFHETLDILYGSESVLWAKKVAYQEVSLVNIEFSEEYTQIKRLHDKLYNFN